MASVSITDCSICVRKYNTSNLRPMVTPCGHTFCEQCLAGLERCPVDRKLILSRVPNFALMPGVDPGSAIANKTPEILAAVKETSSAAKPAPTIAELPLTLPEIAQLYQNQHHIPEDPKRIPTHTEIVLNSPDTPDRSKALFSMAKYLENSNASPEALLKFPQKIINSKNADPYIWMQAHLLRATLNLEKLPVPDYKTVIQDLWWVKNNASIETDLASLYLACFALQGDGGFKIDKKRAQNQFRLISYRDTQVGSFAKLMDAELNLLERNSVKNELKEISEEQLQPSKWVKAKAYYWRKDKEHIEKAYLLITGQSYNHEYLSTDEMRQRLEQSFRQGDPSMTYYEKLLGLHIGYPSPTPQSNSDSPCSVM